MSGSCVRGSAWKLFQVQLVVATVICALAMSSTAYESTSSYGRGGKAGIQKTIARHEAFGRREFHRVRSTADLSEDDVIVMQSDMQTERYQTEHLALTEIYLALAGYQWTAKVNWLNNSVSHCVWEGICCGGDNDVPPPPEILDPTAHACPLYGPVTGVLLSDNNLLGKFPNAAVQNLTALRYLFMDNNHVFGEIYPQVLSVQPNLTEVGLQNLPFLAASLTDLFDALSNSPYINVLYLWGSGFDGLIPTQIQRWRNLGLLYLDSNEIGGTLPTWLADPDIFPKLSGLGLAFCRFVGSIPTEWGRFQSLQAMGLDGNALNGSIPSEIGLIPNLELFLAFGNELSGTIPTTLFQSKSVVELDVHVNQVTSGTTFPHLYSPEDMDYSFDVIDLSFNNLQWNIKDIFFYLLPAGATVFNIEHNFGVSGALPSYRDLLQFGETYAIDKRLERIEILDMSSCNISGELDTNLLKQVFGLNLLAIDVGNNSIGGVVPTSFFRGAVRMALFQADNTSMQIQNDQIAPSDEAEYDGLIRFVNSNERISFEDGGYACDKPRVVGHDYLNLVMSPISLNYTNCQCLSGQGGSPPSCSPISRESEVISLSVVMGILSAVLIVTGLRKWNQYRALSREIRQATQLLENHYQGKNAVGRGARPQKRGFKFIRWLKGESSKPTMASQLTQELLSPIDHSVVSLSNTGGGGFGGMSEHQLPSDLIVAPEDYHIVRFVAHGAEGRVGLGVWNHTMVAVKEYYELPTPDIAYDGPQDSETMERLGFEEWMKEAVVHSTLRHPNVVQLLGICLDPPITLTEWMDCGSLYDCLRSDRSRVEQWGIVQIAVQVARGVLHLHSKGVIHRDLKSLNVLMNQSGVAKVADFGTARKQAEKTMTMGQGTAAWMAPEVFGGQHYTEKCDVYSYGLILWELLTGRIPFEDIKFSYQVGESVQRGVRPPYPIQESADGSVPASSASGRQFDANCRAPILEELMFACWDNNPESRPSFEEIVEKLEASISS